MANKVIRTKLPAAVGAYVSLFKPRDPPAGSQGKPKFSIVLLFPKAEAGKLLGPVVELAKQVARERWGEKGEEVLKKMKYPLIGDGDERYPDDPTFKGMRFIRVSSERAPGVGKRGASGAVEPVFEDDEAYSGCTFIAAVALYPFDKAGSKGVGIGLNNVFVVKKGPRMDGRKSVEDEFAEDAGSAEAAGGGDDLL